MFHCYLFCSFLEKLIHFNVVLLNRAETSVYKNCYPLKFTFENFIFTCFLKYLTSEYAKKFQNWDLVALRLKIWFQNDGNDQTDSITYWTKHFSENIENEEVNAALTSNFWKYYKNTQLPQNHPFIFNSLIIRNAKRRLSSGLLHVMKNGSEW